ncbi:MAG: C25 family cysteine peptidase [Bacteroidota bacterium]
MWNGVDTIYGNEWLAGLDNSIYKFKLDESGVYRINKETLRNAGFPVDAINGNQFRLFRKGEEVAIYTSTNSILGDNDFIEFVGEEELTSLDDYIYKDPIKERLNKQNSIYGNESTYFLTWTDETSDKRIVQIENNLENLPERETTFDFKWNKNYSGTRIINFGIQSGVFWSNYTASEGYGLNLKTSHNERITFNRNITDPGLEATVRVSMGFDKNIHAYIFKLNDKVVLDTSFNGAEVREFEFKIPSDSLSSPLNVSIEAADGNTGKFSLTNIDFIYPRRIDFANSGAYNFQLDGSSNRRYYEVTRFNDNPEGNNLLIDYKNNLRLVPLIDGSLAKFTLPAQGDGNFFMIDAETRILSIDNLEEIKKVDWSVFDQNFVILSHPILYNDELNGGENWVQQYADYRSSPQGGGYTTSIVDINDIYNYFGYGLDYHPMSIRNFAHYIKKNWSNTEFIFIIGKGLEYSVGKSRDNDLNYVPTWGIHGADHLLFASHESNVPFFPIGRIPAKNGNEVRIYLDKIKAFEDRNLSQSIEDKLWKKRFIHLSGGAGTTEQNLIASYLDNMALNIERSRLGASVESFYKESQDIVDGSQAEKLTNSINEGCSYITFFGHSSAQTFDYSINNPEDFENEGRYFVLNAMGCSAGKIHSGANTLSERFVFAEKKGAIAFLSSSGLGYISAYRTYGLESYDEMGNTSLGEPLGIIMRKNMQVMDRTLSTHKLLAQQMTFNGDPAIIISPEEGPDYIIDETTVSIEPGLLNVELENYSISADVINLGNAVNDSIDIKIELEYSDGVLEEIYNERFRAPTYRSNFTFNLPAFTRKLSGFAKYYISVDEGNRIDEFPNPIAENNNELIGANGQRGISVFLFAKESLPIFPQDFGISNDKDLELVASTSNPFLDDQKIIFEIDTTELFNSNFKQTAEVNKMGGLVSWKPTINYEDERVYYWRVSPDSTDGVGFAWKNSSFVHLENQQGTWNQSHYYQYLKNDFTGLEVNNNQNFAFKNKVNDVNLINSQASFEFNYNGAILDIYRGFTITSGVTFFVFDGEAGEAWANPPGGLYDSYTNEVATIFQFAYKTDTEEERAKAINFIQNAVPEGAFVGMLTFHRNNTDYNPELWADDEGTTGQSIFTVLEAEGATEVRSLAESGKVPYFFFFQKGKGAIRELKGETSITPVETSLTFETPRPLGIMNSVEIGPAVSYDQLLWKPTNINEGDDSQVIVTGIRFNGVEDELIVTSNLDVDLESIDANVYERLKITFIAIDSTDRSSPQLDYWRVIYKEIPEAALNPNAIFSFQNDTLQLGDSLRMNLAVDNVRTADMDSLLVHYTIRYPDNSEDLFTQRLAPLLANERMILNFSAFLGFNEGNYSITIDVNPDDDQPEKFHFNNVGVYSFYVEGDRRNPLLDVTFDGIHILNGDLVSSDPLIKIELNDENHFLALNDTSLFEIGLIYPGSSTPIIQSFDSENIVFYPADENNLENKNRAIVDFFPGDLADGIYTLVVKAKDRSGNDSGNLAYRVQFEVVSTSSISNVLNYPNPFSTSTRFVYTMTGRDTPTEFKIQIMTVSGRVVREITRADIGDLRVGTHMTDYAWDGTDEFGDKLANGVYLYRVIAKDVNGDEFEKRDTGTDQFFEKNIGKLVIMR